MLSKEKITREWFREHREECFLAVSFVGILLLFFIRFGVFASDVDWLNQHSVFPEYFRKLFYKTGKLIPSFASNIGGGQNIYNFSYYGFLSPLILPSYLLPFVGMEQYLMAISILCVLASVILLYHWMRSRGFDGKISAFLAMIYLLASPVLYQSYTQWMFINYMPFLILAFIGVDRYMEKKKPCILVVAVFLMIMTSYYFSIAGILALGIYQIASYLRNEEEFHFWKWFRKEFCFGCYILISVCMSAVFLVPTALTLMGRSKESSIKYSLLELLLPRIDWAEFTYSGYGIGLTTLLVTVLIISLFYKKAWERMLSYSLAVILFVPVFELLLNGGLYLRSKVFIPFLPLLLYWMGYFLKQLKKEAVKEKIVLFCFAFTVLLVVIFGMRIPQFPLLLADSIVMLLAYIGYRKYQRLLILMFPVLLFLAGFSVGFHGTQKNMVSQEQMQTVQNAEVSGLIEELMKSDSRGYRMEVHGSDELNAVNINRIYNIHQNISSVYSSTYEMEYDIFRRSVFEVNDAHRNILMQGFTNNTAFLKFMGIKYIITTEPVPNQIPVKKSEHYYVYNVGTVAPVGYATDRVMSSDLYGEFTYPYNQIALLKGSVVINRPFAKIIPKDNYYRNKTKKAVKRCKLEIPTVSSENGSIRKTKKGYQIKAEQAFSVEASVKAAKHNKSIVYLCFDVENQRENKDMYIRVEHEKNKLTAKNHVYYNRNERFHYGVRWDGKKIQMTFSEGEYEITDVQCFVAEESEADSQKLYANPLTITKKWDDGQELCGTINVNKDGYFITSIPYDKGLQIYIDGKKESTEKVNVAFLGCEITKGNHRIRIRYETPGLFAGEMISLAGLMAFIVVIFVNARLRFKR